MDNFSTYDRLTANLVHGMIDTTVNDPNILRAEVVKLRFVLGSTIPEINWYNVTYLLLSMRGAYTE